MNYKDFNLGDWIGHISGVIEDETTLDGNEMRDLVEFLTTLQQEPCKNAISRQKMLKYFEGWKNQIKYYHPYAKNFDIPYEEAVQWVKDMPSVNPQEPKTGWIPVNERLPEKDDLYLIYFDDGEYNLAYFSHGAFGYCGVIAWMPLPEPYKAGGER